MGSEFFKHYVPDNQLLFKMKTMHYLPGKGVVRHLGKKNFKDNRGDHYIQSKKSKKKTAVTLCVIEHRKESH